MTAPEPKPTLAELWEMAGYLKAAADAAYDAAIAADAAAADAAYKAGMARWAREHPPKGAEP